ncbi:MAG TPA: YitT family protein [Candidatus Nanopelagicales bacterium]|jgi:hypothetical protein
MSSVAGAPPRRVRLLALLRGSASIPSTGWTAGHVWRPTPGSFVALLAGLWLFGTGEAFLLAARLGATPWTVLAQGVSLRTGWAIGWSTFAISCVVLLLWWPLRQRPGLGTVLNIVVIAVALEVMYTWLPEPDGYAVRLAFALVGIAMIGLGSGFYLTAGHGPGPRDGWMTGLHWRTGWPVGRIRLCIEVTVLVAGWLLGGTVGVGTLLFALLIGQSLALSLRLVDRF